MLASLGVHNVTSYNIRNANADITGTSKLLLLDKTLNRLVVNLDKLFQAFTLHHHIFFSVVPGVQLQILMQIFFQVNLYAHFDQVLVIVDGAMANHW